jgi:hypothetical protein
MFAIFLMLASFFAHSSTLKVEATCSSETSIGFERTTRRYYIPEEINYPVSTLINA